MGNYFLLCYIIYDASYVARRVHDTPLSRQSRCHFPSSCAFHRFRMYYRDGLVSRRLQGFIPDSMRAPSPFIHHSCTSGQEGTRVRRRITAEWLMSIGPRSHPLLIMGGSCVGTRGLPYCVYEWGLLSRTPRPYQVGVAAWLLCPYRTTCLCGPYRGTQC